MVKTFIHRKARLLICQEADGSHNHSLSRIKQQVDGNHSPSHFKQAQGGSQRTAKLHSGPAPRPVKGKAVWAPAAWLSGHGGVVSQVGCKVAVGRQVFTEAREPVLKQPGMEDMAVTEQEP